MPGRLLYSFCISLLCLPCFSQAQTDYLDSMQSFRKNYIETHEVVTGNDRQYLAFFPIDPAYFVKCRFEKSKDASWFQMNTSGKIKQTYRKYGVLHFSIHDTALQLNIYQSQSLMNNAEFKNYLFIPFTDASSAIDTYGAGRYLECNTTDIKNNVLELDFNKAYNPYCAYTTGYNCPIPPKENQLPVSVRAGEKNYGKAH
jgi:uncharacterized protein